MAQRAGGTVLEEPPPGTRRQRRQRSRSARTGGDGTPPPDESPGGARQARRLHAERRRFWYVLMPAVAVLLALTVAIGALIRANDDSDSDGSAIRGNGATRNANTLLLAHRGSDGRMDLLLLAGTDRDQGSVLLLPTATQVEVPSLGPQALADLPIEGDESLLRTTVENMLGVRVVKTLMLDDASLDAALAAAEPMPAQLNRAVQFEEETGEVFPAGDHQLSAADAARLLVAEQPGSELDRLVTVQDVLDAWLGRLRGRAVARNTVRVAPELATLVALARAQDHRTDSLPVDSLVEGAGELFSPRINDLTRYVNRAFPNALLGGGRARPRVEILNGTGAVGLAQRVATRVVPAGGKVTLTENWRDFNRLDTEVVYYRDADRAAARRMLDALDCGALKKSPSPIGVVDVTIITGADCFPTGEPAGP